MLNLLVENTSKYESFIPMLLISSLNGALTIISVRGTAHGWGYLGVDTQNSKQFRRQVKYQTSQYAVCRESNVENHRKKQNAFSIISRIPKNRL